MFPLWEAGNSGVLGRSRQVLQKRRCSVTCGPGAAMVWHCSLHIPNPPIPHTGSLAQVGRPLILSWEKGSSISYSSS